MAFEIERRGVGSEATCWSDLVSRDVEKDKKNALVRSLLAQPS